MTEGSRRPLKVGLDIPNGDGYMSGTINHWSDVIAMAKAAETPDLTPYGSPTTCSSGTRATPRRKVVGNCWSLLAGLAAATSRVEIGPLVSCMSFRNPGLLAKIAETVDDMSNGRLNLAVGAGWQNPEYTAYGFPYDHRASRFEEGFTILHDLMRTGRSDFKGKYYEVDDCVVLPRGPRLNKIPLVVEPMANDCSN